MKMKSFINLLVFLLGLALVMPHVAAQEETPAATPQASVPIRLRQVDTTEFPTVSLVLTAVNPRQPLPDELADLQLEEAGEPIPDFDLESVPVGMDLIFVVDANESILELDGGELMRLQKVQRSIIRYATQFMQPQELDRVSVIVPDEAGTNGRFLFADADTPSDVVDGLVDYAPQSDNLGPTPLQAMLQQAIEHAAQIRAENGRFQAILLFTDGAQLNQQLDFTGLVAAAERSDLAISAAILGARADPNEVENVSQLTDPTDGSYLHMPDQEATDPIYESWQDLGKQMVLSFASAQRSSGRYDLTIVQGENRLAATYELALQPPAVSLLLEPGAIVRSGEAPNTPLADLEPALLQVPVAISWPDGQPRDVTAVSLLVNDEAVANLTAPQPDVAGGLLLDWDLSATAAGTYTLSVEVADELGLTATSVPVVLELVEERPQPPSSTEEEVPTAAATAGSPAEVLVETAVDNSALVGMAAGLLLLLFLLLLWQRRRGARAERVDMSDEIADLIVSRREAAAPAAEAKPAPPRDMVASLHWLDETRDPIRIEAETTTFGRDTAVADVVIADDSVSPLHARVKRSGDAYWLYDEGSATGTYLNFDRLGLGPRILHDQNRVQLGQVRFLFSLVPVIDEYSVSSDVPADGPPAAGAEMDFDEVDFDE